VERASRAWVEEEGEIFRKGTKLGVVDDDEEESGEQLKQEVSLFVSPYFGRMRTDDRYWIYM